MTTGEDWNSRGWGERRKRTSGQGSQGGEQYLSTFKVSRRLKKRPSPLCALFKKREMQKQGFRNFLFTYLNVIR